MMVASLQTTLASESWETPAEETPDGYQCPGCKYKYAWSDFRQDGKTKLYKCPNDACELSNPPAKLAFCEKDDEYNDMYHGFWLPEASRPECPTCNPIPRPEHTYN